MFSKKEDKVKSEKELKLEREAFEKEQKERLLALRVDSELKIEKSAIVTMTHLAELIKTQAIINKNNLQRISDLSQSKKEIFVELKKFTKSSFADVNTMKAHLNVLIDNMSRDIENIE